MSQFNSTISHGQRISVEKRMKVPDLRLCLSALHIPSKYNELKSELLGKFWSAFTKASAAFVSGNKVALKLFAHAIARSGRIEAIQILNLHTVQGIEGYRADPLSPTPQPDDYDIFSNSTAVDSSSISSVQRRPIMSLGPRIVAPQEISPAAPTAEASSQENTGNASILNGKPFILKITMNKGAFMPPNTNKAPLDIVLDAKNFSHYVFNKPPNFTTIKYLKRFVAADCSTMQSPIYFNLEDSFFDRLKDNHRVRVFVAVIKNHKLPENEKKKEMINVSLPRSFTTHINGTIIYQERYMVLHNNQPSTFVSADLSLFIKQLTNSIKFSWTSSGSNAGYILVSVELVKILTVDEIVDNIVKKPKPEKANGSVNIDLKDDELESTSEIITLRDPLSLSRIEKPGRSSDCKHLQFFDLKTYFTLNIKSEQLICPVCNQHRKWSSLCFDEFYHGLLPQVPENVDKVEIFPDGTWKCVEDGERRKLVRKSAETRETSADIDIRGEVKDVIEKTFAKFAVTNESLKESLIDAVEEWGKTHAESSKIKRRKINQSFGLTMDDPIYISD